MITYLEQFQVHSKTEEVQRFPIDSLLHRCKAFPISAFSTRVGYLLLILSINTIDGLTVICCNCPRFIVYMTVHSWCCTLCVARYMSLYKCIVTFSHYYTSAFLYSHLAPPWSPPAAQIFSGSPWGPFQLCSYSYCSSVPFPWGLTPVSLSWTSSHRSHL